jgi:hypothetical protein
VLRQRRAFAVRTHRLACGSLRAAPAATHPPGPSLALAGRSRWGGPSGHLLGRASLGDMHWAASRSHLPAVCLVGLLWGCGTAVISTNDAGSDGGVADAGPDAGVVDAGPDAGKVNVCSAAAGTVAWTESIPAATASLVPMDIVAASTNNDVVVSDIYDASTFEQYRWNASGVLLSHHQDAKGAYAGTMFPSNLVLDSQNDIFYGLVLTGLPQPSNSGAAVTWTRLKPDGGAVFVDTYTATSGQPSVAVFQAGADTGGGLHTTLTMGTPYYFDPAVYCWGSDGADVGPSAQSLATGLTASDFLWPSLDANLYLLQDLPVPTSLPCGALAVPDGGATALGKFTGGGGCLWTKLLMLPSSVIQKRLFRQGADGSLSLAVVYSGTINFGGGPLSSSGTNSLALARFDSAGNLLWTKNFGGTGSRFNLGSLDTNADGMGILTAGYAGNVDLGGGILPSNADTFLAVFDSAGTLKWSKEVTVGSSGQLLAAVGSCGLVLATNSLTVDLGTGPLSTATPPSSATIGVAALGL